MNNYQIQLERKIRQFGALLAPLQPPAPQIFASMPTGYRMRAEFRIWHDQGKLFYAMSKPGEKMSPKSVIRITSFPPVCSTIALLMPRLIEVLQSEAELSRRLYQVEFLATLKGELLVTLIYHRHLEQNWQTAARKLAGQLNIALIGRSRKQKIVLTLDYVRERLIVQGKSFHYRQYDQSFTQPNARVCCQMLTWACERIGDPTRDLLELYCGNGNFTLPLARRFRKVLATEISRIGIRALRENLVENQIENVAVARLSAREFSDAHNGVRGFNRLETDKIFLTDYDFASVFVDPPRAGIDPDTLELLQGFSEILYISCNAHSLADNLSTLTQTHRITAIALFDQFPFTPHIESGVLLQRR